MAICCSKRGIKYFMCMCCFRKIIYFRVEIAYCFVDYFPLTAQLRMFYSLLIALHYSTWTNIIYTQCFTQFYTSIKTHKKQLGVQEVISSSYFSTSARSTFFSTSVNEPCLLVRERK